MGALLRRHFSLLSAWSFTFFFACWPYFSAVAVSGMETNVLLSLIVLSAFLLERRSRLSGAALAALALVRPEGLPAAVVLAIGARWRDRMIAAVLVAAALGGLYAYFGTVIPQSLIAKSQIYGTPGPWAGSYWWEWLVPFPIGHWPTQGDTVPLAVLSIVLAPSFVLGLPVMWQRRGTSAALAAAAGLAIWIGYTLLGVAYFWWYLEVPLAAVVMVGVAGFPRLAKSKTLVAACALFVLGLWSLAPKLYTSRSATEGANFGRAAQYLRMNCRPGDKVLLEPIGIVGYTAPVIVVDEVGLVSPQVVRRRRGGPGWYTDLERSERPVWLVLRKGTLHGGEAFAGVGAPFRSVAERESLIARYAVMDTGVPEAGDGALSVLKRIR
jgi:hypothetical protein